VEGFAESETLDEFWQNLKRGKDLVKDVSRWTADRLYYHGFPVTAIADRVAILTLRTNLIRHFLVFSSLEAIHMEPSAAIIPWRNPGKALGKIRDMAARGVRRKNNCGVYGRLWNFQLRPTASPKSPLLRLGGEIPNPLLRHGSLIT